MPAGRGRGPGPSTRECLGLGRRAVVVADVPAERVAERRAARPRPGARRCPGGPGVDRVGRTRASSGAPRRRVHATASAPAGPALRRSRAGTPIGSSARSRPATSRWTRPPVSMISSPSRTYRASSYEWTWRRDPAARRPCGRSPAPCGRLPCPARRGRCGPVRRRSRSSGSGVRRTTSRGGRRGASRSSAGLRDLPASVQWRCTGCQTRWPVSATAAVASSPCGANAPDRRPRTNQRPWTGSVAGVEQPVRRRRVERDRVARPEDARRRTRSSRRAIRRGRSPTPGRDGAGTRAPGSTPRRPRRSRTGSRRSGSTRS